MSTATAVEITEEVKGEESFSLKSDIEFNDGKDHAVIKYADDSFDKFIGPELEKALKTIGEKTDEYFGLVINDSTGKTKELLSENENLKIVEVNAPIYSREKGDKLEILNVRDEIEDTEVPLKSLNVKLTQNISSPIVLQSAAALLRKKD